MVTTFVQRKKRQRKFLVALSFVVLLTAVVLFRGNGGDRIPAEGDLLPEFSESTAQAAQALISDIFIPQDFFEDGILEQFSSYEPIGVPEIKGRTNPFAPLVQPAVEPVDADEEGEEF